MKISKILVFSIFLLLFINACEPTEEPEGKVVDIGKTITFDYASGFDNGTLFDTTFENAAREAGIYNPNKIYQPERAVVGKDPLIPGLLEALLGMKEGEVKNIRIPPEKAYGAKIENSTHILARRAFDDPDDLEVGQIVIIASDARDRIPVFITELNEKNVTIDQNHPLAGEFIQFAIILRTIELI